MAVVSLLSPNWASTVSRKLGMCSGADPRVISGSFLACLNCSLDADEIHCASMARAPLVLLELRKGAPFPLEYRQCGRMERVAGFESPLEGLLGSGFVGGRIHSGPFGWESVGPFEAPFSVRPSQSSVGSWDCPRFSNSRRRTTSLISDSSLAMRSWATRFTTLVMRSCHSRSALGHLDLAAGQAHHGRSLSCACHCGR